MTVRAPEPASPSMSSGLPRWSADRFDVPCNEALLQRLLDDMARNAGSLMPAPAWRLPDARARGGLVSPQYRPGRQA